MKASAEAFQASEEAFEASEEAVVTASEELTASLEVRASGPLCTPQEAAKPPPQPPPSSLAPHRASGGGATHAQEAPNMTENPIFSWCRHGHASRLREALENGAPLEV